METMKFINWVYKLSCWGLGSLFIYSGTIKLIAPLTFATLIEAYGIVPDPLLMTVAVILPVLEVVFGMGLLMNIKGAVGAIAVLLIMFIGIMAYGIWMGLDVDCGCFGPHDPEAVAFQGLWATLYRDMILLAGISFVYGWRRYRTIQTITITRFINDRLNKRRRNNGQF